ncbi:MAG: sulfur reduction protein DsrE [Bacillaceae bacterium G1]|nr:sulfur reduction protein DsrE [Bacillota bacterium]OJF17355.1 MAG: sulfur reduction protein DsrE [Bacillaceae bacterium G1]
MSKRVAIIAANGSLFDAYKVFNIATAAAASEAEVGIFFTFEGLNLIHKEAHKQLPLPPGKEAMKDMLAQANIPSIPELLQMAKDLGVRLTACQMSMDLMNVKEEDLIDGIEVAGAAAFLDFAYDADVTLTF